ncbi:MAG: helix-turn-helix domain-containing protein [Alphaproteobacteria bacterium]|nr:helix-turn-helix domain-containing protein [Alphaproteobacteria bacterium]
MDDDCIRAEKARQGSPFLTTKEAAYYLSVCPRTLEKMRLSGRGPRYRGHGRLVRYHIEDLEAWSNKRHRKPYSKKREQ